MISTIAYVGVEHSDMPFLLALLRSAHNLPNTPDPNLEIILCRVVSGADYNLVLGMPGAGKTSTIVAAVAALAAAGRSVLLTSYTNRCRAQHALTGLKFDHTLRHCR